MRLTISQRSALQRVCEGQTKSTGPDGPALRALERKGLVTAKSVVKGDARRIYWTATVSGEAENADHAPPATMEER